MKKSDQPNGARPILVLLIAAAITGITLRILVILSGWSFYDADNAICALMAKHIAEGRELPLYIWMSHYGGTLECYVAAGMFKIFGVSTVAHFSTGMIFSLLTVLFGYLLARRVLDRYGALVALILLLLPPFEIMFATIWMGSILGQTLPIAMLMLYLIVRWNDEPSFRSVGSAGLIGLVSGFGVWLTPHTVPFILTALVVFLIKDKKFFLSKLFVVFIAGCVLGHLPGIIYYIQYPGATFYRMGGRLLDLDRSALASPNLVAVAVRQTLWRLSTVPASLARFPGMFRSLTGWFNFCVFLAALVWVVRRQWLAFRREHRLRGLDIMLIFLVLLLFFYSVCVGEKPIRYSLAAYAVLPVVVGALLSDLRRRAPAVAIILLCLIMVFSAYTVSHVYAHRRHCSYARVAAWMAAHGHSYGFADFYVAYPITFESREEVILSPTLHYATYCDKSPAYTKQVRDSDAPVYVVTKDECPAIGRALRKLDVCYTNKIINEIAVYYGLSRKVYPEELKLGPGGSTQ